MIRSASSSSARARSLSSRSSGVAPLTAATTTSSSGIRRRERRSRRASSRSDTSSRRYTCRHRLPFRPFHDLRHTSLTHAAAAGNPRSTSKREPGTRRARSPSGTCMPHKSSSLERPRRARRGCSASREAATPHHRPPETHRVHLRTVAHGWAAPMPPIDPTRLTQTSSMRIIH